VGLSDDRPFRNENEESSSTVHVTSAGSEGVGSECLSRIMGRHECLRIPSDPSHSGNAEQGNDGQGSPLSDRTLLAQPSMVPNSTRVVDSPPQEAPRVGSPPLAPFRESLPQLPFFYKLHAWKLSGASSEQNNLLSGGEPLTLISQSGLSTKLGVGKGFIQS
jgi:hypothetical protein